MKRVFSELSPEELRGLEVKLKKVGKRAAALMEESWAAPGSNLTDQSRLCYNPAESMDRCSASR